MLAAERALCSLSAPVVCLPVAVSPMPIEAPRAPVTVKVPAELLIVFSHGGRMHEEPDRRGNNNHMAALVRSSATQLGRDVGALVGSMVNHSVEIGARHSSLSGGSIRTLL